SGAHDLLSGEAIHQHAAEGIRTEVPEPAQRTTAADSSRQRFLEPAELRQVIALRARGDEARIVAMLLQFEQFGEFLLDRGLVERIRRKVPVIALVVGEFAELVDADDAKLRAERPESGARFDLRSCQRILMLRAVILTRNHRASLL